MHLTDRKRRRPYEKEWIKKNDMPGRYRGNDSFTARRMWKQFFNRQCRYIFCSFIFINSGFGSSLCRIRGRECFLNGKCNRIIDSLRL